MKTNMFMMGKELSVKPGEIRLRARKFNPLKTDQLMTGRRPTIRREQKKILNMKVDPDMYMKTKSQGQNVTPNLAVPVDVFAGSTVFISVISQQVGSPRGTLAHTANAR